MNGIPIRQFVGLRPKMYSLVAEDGTTKATAKGISRATARHHLRHELYLEALHSGHVYRHVNACIRNSRHILNTVFVNKVSLSAFDDKRYILNDGVTSLAYGHCDIL